MTTLLFLGLFKCQEKNIKNISYVKKQTILTEEFKIWYCESNSIFILPDNNYYYWSLSYFAEVQHIVLHFAEVQHIVLHFAEVQHCASFCWSATLCFILLKCNIVLHFAEVQHCASFCWSATLCFILHCILISNTICYTVQGVQKMLQFLIAQN